jgi:hypothetical protein
MVLVYPLAALEDATNRVRILSYSISSIVSFLSEISL